MNESIQFKTRERGLENRVCGPSIVHCSAGCGRTGTFCLVDQVILQLKRKSTIHQLRNEGTRDVEGDLDLQQRCLASPNDVKGDEEDLIMKCLDTPNDVKGDEEDLIMKCLDTPNDVKGDEEDLIMKCLELFRSQRVSMVQTLEQFVFCYEAILAYFAKVG